MNTVAIRLLMMLGVVLSAGWACSDDDDDDTPPADDDDDDTSDDDDDDDTQPECLTYAECPGEQICRGGVCHDPVFPVMRNHATDPVSIDPSGANVLINGRLIRPPEPGTVVGTFPTNLEISPDGAMLVVNENGFGSYINPEAPRTKFHGLRVIDPETMQIVQTLPMPNRSMYFGLRFSADGSRLYVAGGQDNRLHVYRVTAEHRLEADRILDLGECYGGDIALNAAEDRLYIACTVQETVKAVRPAEGTVEATWDAGTRPYNLALAPGGDFLFVSNWTTVVHPENGDTVTVLDTGTGAIAGTIPVGQGPEGLVLSPDGSRLYVVCEDTDDLWEIAVATRTVTRTLPLLENPQGEKGLRPLMADISPDGSTLYVASSGENAIHVVETASGAVKGAIPAEFYPSDVAVSPDGATLYIANGKGRGDGPTDVKEETVGRQMFGTVTRVAVPGAEALAAHTAMVAENNHRNFNYFDVSAGNDTPVPAVVGEKESPIRHVFWIMKENLTYDSVFGDMEIGRGDPELTMFPEEITPNHHKLAREFTLFDAFFVDSEGSVDGHQWALLATNPDANQKAWTLDYANFGFPYPTPGISPASYPESDYILVHLIKEGFSVRSFGVGENFGLDLLTTYKDYWSENYPLLFTMSVPDRVKAQSFIDEFHQMIEDGTLPQFVFLLLPNDHTSGLDIGEETPQSLVADNDEGLGMIVQAISQSPVWEESVIFVFEDDTQNGYDHVDGHRSIGLAIGPYVKRGYVSSVTYSYPNLHRTAQLILGASPITRFVETASPMFDIFEARPDTAPYAMAPRTYPFEVYEGEVNELVKLSREVDWDRVDQAPRASEILWRHIKGTRPPERR